MADDPRPDALGGGMTRGLLLAAIVLVLSGHAAAAAPWRECHVNAKGQQVCRQCRFERADSQRVVRCTPPRIAK